MFAKLFLKKIEFDFVTMQYTAYFLIFLKSFKFLKPGYFLKYKSNILKYILIMKKHWEQSGFLPSLSCSFKHALLSVSVTLCFANIVTFSCSREHAMLR